VRGEFNRCRRVCVCVCGAGPAGGPGRSGYWNGVMAGCGGYSLRTQRMEACDSTLDIGQTQCPGHTPGPSPKSSAAAALLAAPAAAEAATSESACEKPLRRTPVGAVYCRPPPPPTSNKTFSHATAAERRRGAVAKRWGQSETGATQHMHPHVGKWGAPWRWFRGRRSTGGRGPSRCRAPSVSSPGSARSCAGRGWSMPESRGKDRGEAIGQEM
jgi:hypothetical protein